MALSLNDKIEELLRGQFVDSAYEKDGTTSWGIFKTREKILSAVSDYMDEVIPKKLSTRHKPSRIRMSAINGYNQAIDIMSQRKEQLLK